MIICDRCGNDLDSDGGCSNCALAAELDNSGDGYSEDEWYEEDYEAECMFCHETLCKAANGQLYLQRVTAWAYDPDEEIDSFYWHWETEHFNVRRQLNQKGMAISIMWARNAKPGASIELAKLFSNYLHILNISSAKRVLVNWKKGA